MSQANSLLIEEIVTASTSRRRFLQSLSHLGLMSIVAGSGLLIPKRLSAPTLPEGFALATPPTAPIIKGPELALSLHNTHTGETLKNHVFWAEGNFIEEQLRTINHHFRDHRTGDVHAIDPELLRLLTTITDLVDTKEPIHLISGYRSPKTNKILASQSSGVAKKSQHLCGKAADIVIPGRSLKQVQHAAKSLKVGGVGRYATFVHVDTGRVRSWGLA
ncbi:YcbK family protein [Candidatus Paracaedibacter symbiosus]|uniref:YcbK family protein n=1 Tax=Candidatus Paracaedibacter symbiosus TaxID=244582 RepID=UPI000AEC44F7|nr:DUF882 domain-containing protein [Candidatus Paracaedibacter symbiosus]